MDGAGTISGRWALAAGRAGLNGCRICSGPTLPGTKLCAQCKAALKRARQETVSELAPPLKRPAARGSARPRAESAAPTGPAQQRSARVWRNTAITLVAIAAAALGYTVLHLMRPPHPLAPVQAEQAAAPVPAPSTAIVRPDPAAGAQAREGPPVPAAAHAAKPATARLPAKRTTEAAPVLAQQPTDRLPATAEVTPPVPAPEPAPAPRPAPPPRDRWQLMADEIAQCGRNGFFAGVICEQKIRLKYCEGYWGQSAQCPNGIPNDHGQ